MDPIKYHYFQFRKAYDYPVYIRLSSQDMNQKWSHLLNELGFIELNEKEIKKVSLAKPFTKLLTWQMANGKMEAQIMGSDILDQFGFESITIQAGTPVYTFRKVGMLVMYSHKNLWDLALCNDLTQTDQMVGLRVVLVRFLAQALSDLGVLVYWGTMKDDAMIIMKQSQSFGEALIVDYQKRVIFTNGGENKMTSSMKILRKDKENSGSNKMKREELISFLSVSHCLLSFKGLTPSQKKNIFDLTQNSLGFYFASEQIL